ncbi:DUF1499 domain-containing protein [Thioalkalivibrio sp. ALE19]|uniref:DUF1499 domain-containing protein n=1 Tax=Thioalkalivibrio sp. ALE19 TaxID=1266909 RepID=UPI0004162BB4|nr:DUF1499 domain-containing protein [Thioalkalivibrio sp. ALE19]
MTSSNRNPISILAVVTLLLALAAVATLITAAVGTRADWWHFTTGLDVATWAIYLAIAATLAGLGGFYTARPAGCRSGISLVIAGLVLSVPLVGAGAHFEYAAGAYPPINDVTTDPDDPPTFWEVPDPQTYPGGETAELQREGYPDLGPLLLDHAPDTVFERAEVLAEERGWEIVSAMNGELEAIDTTFLFGFEDYVMVRVLPEGDGARVDMRSYSRLGQIDRGVNATRIRSFLDDLERAL